MKAYSKNGPSRWYHWATAFAGAGLLISTAYGSHGVIPEQRLGRAEAQALLDTSKQAPGNFPVVINDAVLEQLNRYTRTPDGRAFSRAALQNLESHRELIERTIEAYGYPTELLAIPFVESGYQNLPARANPLRAAGLWQFIAGTARNYGLRVDGQVDDRLDVALQTDAAMRYLGAMHLRFQRWDLAAMAYNSGEGRVQQGITATGSRDVWRLIDAGFEGDRTYVAKLMAAVLIVKNPSLVE